MNGLWDLTLFESKTAKKIASWCFDYFQEYKEAPGKNIETIFYKKVEQGLPKELAEEIEEDIFPSLSEESTKDTPSIEFVVAESERYFTERRLLLHSDLIRNLVSTNQLSEAEQKALKYTQVTSKENAFSKHILAIEDIRKKELKRAPLLMSPWLRQGQTTIIYAGAGVGKSLLSISVAYLLGLKNYDEDYHEIGTWQVKRPTGCLYMDGEIGEQEMEERISQFEWLGRQHKNRKLKVFSVPEYQFATEDTFTLATRTNQMKVIQWLKDNPDYKLIVLDSVSTLFGLVEENDNSEWSNKVNPFLRDLRALEVACLLLHHTGKDNKRGLRGASAMSAMAHNIFKLSDHPDKDPDSGEAWFVLTKDKQRMSGFNFKTFAIHYSQNDEKTETHWKITKY
jgi:hypothetical protein